MHLLLKPPVGIGGTCVCVSVMQLHLYWHLCLRLGGGGEGQDLRCGRWSHRDCRPERDRGVGVGTREGLNLCVGRRGEA